MLKEFAQYLVSLKPNQTYTIHGDTYSDNELHRIAPHVDRPDVLKVTSLSALAALVRTEIDVLNLPIFIRVDGAWAVSAFSTLDDVMKRDGLYRAECVGPMFRAGWRDYESAVIELRSAFLPSADVDYLLNLLSRIYLDSGVQNSDNGVSQSVEVRSGVSLKSVVQIKPRVSLTPYRTFLEVAQPESEFILRVNDEMQIGLFEADGGAWELEARANIAEFFEAELKKEIEAGKVVVLR